MSTGGFDLSAITGAAGGPGDLASALGVTPPADTGLPAIGAAGLPQVPAPPAQPRAFNVSRDIKAGTPLHKLIISRLKDRLSRGLSAVGEQSGRWSDAEDRVLAYVPTSEIEQRRKNRRRAGEPVYTTIQIPYTFAQLMAAHTYWTSVFFGRSPILQVSGRHGETEQQTQAMEALLDYQFQVGQMAGPMYLWFYDAGKYGVGVLGEYWDEEIIQYGTIEEQLDASGNPQKVQTSYQSKGYCGTRVYNIAPQDFIPDPRQTVKNFQKGEFAGVRVRIAWNEIVRREKRGLYVNTDQIRSSRGTESRSASQGSGNLVRPLDDWEQKDSEDPEAKMHPAVVTAFEVHVDLIPTEWKLGPSDFPEKWVFTITEDYSVLLGAQPLGQAHGKFPFNVMEIEVEPYGRYARGIPEIMDPVQNTMDWLLNSHFYNVRSALNMGFIIDPTKIVMKDVKKGGPGFVWRMRPEAFGQNIDTFYKQVQVQDVTQQNMGDLNTMFSIGERIFGINDQILGMLNTGGRKTATEVRTGTGFGVNRLKTCAEYVSNVTFGPFVSKLIQQSQQYYDGAQKLKIVGDLSQLAGPSFINVDKQSIAGDYDFTPVDGTMPIDRFAQVTLWKDLISQVATAPQILQKYDLAKIFAWVAQLGGIKNLSRFEIQPMDPRALAAAAQAGNVVPISQAPGGNTSAIAGQPSAGGNAAATAAY